MKRQRRTHGSILRIDLGDGYICYAQDLSKGVVFFDLKVKKELAVHELEKLFTLKALFIISVYNDAITTGHWQKVGKLSTRDEYEHLPVKFIQDDITGDFEIYDPNTGEISSSTYEECQNLECAAVWEAAHVESRLRDHFSGTKNKWVESLRPRKEDAELRDNL